MKLQQILSLAFVAILVMVVGVVNGSISGTAVNNGDCICANTNVNARTSGAVGIFIPPGSLSGTVITTIPCGTCVTATGGHNSADGYEWYELIYNSQHLWSAGNYFNHASASYCGRCENGRTAKEMRGAWITTVANIDWPESSTASTSQNQADLISLLDSLQNAGFNAVVFQVRSVGDAMYQSSIEPWSRYLTGSQGQAPSPLWDPLDFVVREAHRRNMELHAWFNPYRAKYKSTSTSGLVPGNMAIDFPSVAYAYGGNLWMDPGSQQVQDRVNTVIMDVVNRYDIDAVQFDDYFYPYPTSDAFPDTATYNAYRNGGGSLSLSDWRRDNVNRLIQRLGTNIKAAKPYVKFGISPFGIWRSGQPSGVVGTSSVDVLYADSRMWLQNGWMDYLAPQLFWQIDPPAQSFTALTDWWSDPAQNPLHRHIYCGLADYKVVGNNWPVSEITRQIQETQARHNRYVYGTIHFSSKYIPANSHGLTDALRSVYPTPAIIPSMTAYMSGVGAPSAPQVTSAGSTLDWSGSSKTNVRSWGVYLQTTDCLTLQTVLPVDVTLTTVAVSGTYIVSAINRLGAETDSSPVSATGSIVGSTLLICSMHIFVKFLECLPASQEK